MKLDVEHLGFTYPNGNRVFSNVSFSVNTSEILCFLGPNGCGKTTLLNCIAGLLSQNTGDILLDKKTCSKFSAAELARNIGYVPQNIVATFDYSVIDYVVTGCAPYMRLFNRPGEKEYSKAYAVLEKMGISYLSEQSYAQISGGERQQVSIARTIVQHPSFILLDEPTAHLDYGNQLRLLSLVQSMANDEYGILMTTHNPDHVLTLNSNVVMMNKDGTCTTGQAVDIVNEKNLRNLYGIDIFLEESTKAKRCVCVSPPLDTSNRLTI